MTSFLATQTVKTGKIHFSTIFGQKGCQILFSLNSEPRFEILSSFATYMTHYCCNSQILILGPHCNFKHFKWHVRSIFSEFEILDVRFEISVPKYIRMGGIAITMPKKMVITTRPSITPAHARFRFARPKRFLAFSISDWGHFLLLHQLRRRLNY